MGAKAGEKCLCGATVRTAEEVKLDKETSSFEQELAEWSDELSEWADELSEWGRDLTRKLPRWP
jgi:hypothetical protein